MQRMDSRLSLRHERIDADPPAGRMMNCHTADLTDNGRPDVVVTALGSNPRVTLPWVGQLQLRYTSVAMRLIPYLETNVFWYENPGWERHSLASERDLQLAVGSTLAEFRGDGTVDLVVGQGVNNHDIYLYEQPADPREAWTQHLVTDRFHKYHDIETGDVDGDGEAELVGLSQESETLFYFDVPEAPYRSPWPEECLHVVDEDIHDEGLLVADVDGDGNAEILAGTNVYHRTTGGWEREAVVTGWDPVRTALGDLDGDGELEFIAAEGDSPTYGTRPGRLAWFDPPDWEPTVLRDDLFCPHSLQVADFTGDGRPDIFTAEMGLFDNTDPEAFVFRNLGDGTFEEQVVSRGVPTHQAKAVDLTGDGRLDVVGKSYEPTEHVDVWYNEP